MSKVFQSIIISSFFFSGAAMAQSSPNGVVVISDPAVLNAAAEFNSTKERLKNEKCADLKKPAADFSEAMKIEYECICRFVAELVPVNDKKIQAFKDLVQRRPELMNQMVKLEGQPGNLFISEETLKSKTVEEFRASMKCNQ